MPFGVSWAWALPKGAAGGWEALTSNCLCTLQRPEGTPFWQANYWALIMQHSQIKRKEKKTLSLSLAIWNSSDFEVREFFSLHDKEEYPMRPKAEWECPDYHSLCSSKTTPQCLNFYSGSTQWKGSWESSVVSCHLFGGYKVAHGFIRCHSLKDAFLGTSHYRPTSCGDHLHDSAARSSDGMQVTYCSEGSSNSLVLRSLP